MLRSGYIWHTLYLIFLEDNQQLSKLNKYFPITEIIIIGLEILRHLLGFADKQENNLKKDIKKEESIVEFESQVIQNMKGVGELKAFHEIMMNLFGEALIHILIDKLDVQFINRLNETDLTEKKSLLLEFTRKLQNEYCNPQFLWNKRTREELKNILERQIEHIKKEEAKNMNSYNYPPTLYIYILSNFKYETYKDEVIVDHIFLRLLNRDVYSRVRDPRRFLTKLLETLRSECTPNLVNTDSWALTKAQQILEAVVNMILYKSGLELGIIQLKENILFIASYLNIKYQQVGNIYEGIMDNCFTIFEEIAKKKREVSNLLEYPEVIMMIYENIYLTNTTYCLNRLLDFLTSILPMGIMYSIENTLATTGIGFMLFRFTLMTNNVGYGDNNCSSIDNIDNGNKYSIPPQILQKLRLKSFNLFQNICKISEGYKLFTKVLPQCLLKEIRDKDDPKDSQGWLDYFDGRSESIYLVWDSKLVHNIGGVLDREGMLLYNRMKAGSDGVCIWDPVHLVEFSSRMNRGHAVVLDILASRYILQPCAIVKVIYIYIYTNIYIIRNHSR